MKVFTALLLFAALSITPGEAQTKSKKHAVAGKTCPQICHFRHGPGSPNVYSLCVANCLAYRAKKQGR